MLCRATLRLWPIRNSHKTVSIQRSSAFTHLRKICSFKAVCMNRSGVWMQLITEPVQTTRRDFYKGLKIWNVAAKDLPRSWPCEDGDWAVFTMCGDA